jgi:membrane glycosyltransferase
MLGRQEEAQFGGRWRVVLSASWRPWAPCSSRPINMIFNTKFVLFTLLGQGVGWVAQKRSADEDGTDWREAIITHGPQTLFGLSGASRP